MCSSRVFTDLLALSFGSASGGVEHQAPSYHSVSSHQLRLLKRCRAFSSASTNLASGFQLRLLIRCRAYSSASLIGFQLLASPPHSVPSLQLRLIKRCVKLSASPPSSGSSIQLHLLHWYPNLLRHYKQSRLSYGLDEPRMESQTVSTHS